MTNLASASVLEDASRKAFVFPASFAQRRLWFLHQFAPGTAVYNIPAPVRITTPLDVAALRRTINELVRRHESLRTTFMAVDGEPMQVIAPTLSVPLELVDLRSLPPQEREAEAQRLAAADAQRPFSLTTGPLLRATLLRLHRSDHVFLLTMHHIVSDGWSMTVLLRELNALYEAFSAGRPSPLVPLPVQYADFSQWQHEHLRGETRERLLRYWTQQLRGAPESIELPTDRPRPSVQTHRGGGHTVRLDAELYRRVVALGREQGCTPFMTLLAALSTLLGRYTGERDVVLGTPIANRTRPEIEGVVGLFVNTLVLRVDLDGDPSVRELLARARELTLEAYAHQDMPFEWLVEHLRPTRNLGHNPLFQVMLVMNETDRPRAEGAVAGGDPGSEALAVTTGTSKFDLTLSVATDGDGALLMFEYDLDLFDPPTIARLAGHFEQLLRSAVDDPEGSVWALPIMSAAERERVLAWSTQDQTAAPPLVPATIVRRARRDPEATAVICGRQRLSYAELVSRANRVAAHLAALGVAPETRVCVCMDRSVELPVAMLGVLLAGAAFVPLDPSYPRDRLSFMLEDSAPLVVLTQEHLADALPRGDHRVVRLDSQWAEIAGHDDADRRPALRPEGLAYVIYTSGSTGRPKGAMNTHAGIANRLAWGQRTFELRATDRVLHKTPTSFDISVWEIFWPLTAGATLVMARPEGHRDPEYLIELISAERITVAHFVPSMLRIFVEHPECGRCTSLQRVIVSGEALAPDLEARFFSRLPASLHNLYGPTEASIEVTAWTCRRPGGGPTVPIGRPTSNTRIYLLDPRLEPVPVGVPGELYIGGVSVGRGYLGRPGLTAERFVPDPYAQHPGDRMYRTGDRARHRTDGAIEYLGRFDHQVKVRGFRIELGEIEARLRQHPQVADAVVITHEHAADDLRLVGYVVLSADVDEPPCPSLRDHLLETLPEYMVPSDFVRLDRLPLMPNGKLDRRALPRPNPAQLESGAAYVAPRSPLEDELARLFAEILQVERVGIEDDFFELGGHSLLATRLVARVRQAHRVAIPLRRMFETRTVAGLAVAITDAGAQARESGVTGDAEAALVAPLIARGGASTHPLSFTQRRLWVLDRLLPGNPTYNVPFVLRLPGPLDVPALRRSLQEIVDRHDVLRIHVALVDGEPVQVVAPALTLRLESIDLEDVPPSLREEQAQRRAQQQAQIPFDLRAGPMLRAALLRLQREDHVLVLVMHHIVSDGWSLRILYRELAALYPAFAAGQSSPLPPVPIQYSDFVRWQAKWLRGDALERLLGYWRTQLEGLPPLIDLPTDRPRPAVASGRGALHPFSLDASLVAAARVLGREEGATLFMTLLAVWLVALRRYTDDTDLVVGSAIANRTRPELEGLIGFFANTMVLRTSLVDGPSFRELLARVRSTTLDAYEHQDVPFELLVEQLQPERSLSHNPLFQVAFQCTSAEPDDQGEPAPSRVAPPAPVVSTGTAKFDLSLSVFEGGAQAQAYLEYDTDLFDETSAVRFAEHFEALLRRLVREPDRPLSSHSLPTSRSSRPPAPPREVSRPSSRCVVQAVAEHASRRPEEVAVVADDATLRWAELQRTASALARGLAARGIGPGARVGIRLGRSAGLIQAMLGVLHARAICVPLDPSEPAARVARALRDAGARWLLARADDDIASAIDGVQALAVDELCATVGGVDVAPAPAGLDDPACLVYESGARGPQGVSLSHRALGRAALDDRVSLRASDRVAVRSRVGSSTGLFEVFGALTAGACMVCIGDDRLTPRRLGLQLREHAISVAVLPAASMPRLAREFPWSLRTLRTILCDASPWLEAPLRAALPEDVRARVSLVSGWPEAGGIGLVRSLADPVEREDSPTLGHGVAGLELEVLDDALEPVPEGMVGELYLGGTPLALGIHGTGGGTADAFVPDPASATAGARRWRSGLRVRRRFDGSLEARPSRGTRMSRDGVRIEAGEVEAILERHDAVIEAAVVARRPRGLHERGPAAFVVTSDDHATALDELGAWLEAHLPPALRPGSIERIPSLPRTPRGAIDRRTLAALVVSREPSGEAPSRFEAPRTELERTIARIWETAFGLDQVGVHDDFFDLGGHSLLATQVVARLGDALGHEIPLRRIFEAPTIARLAEALAPRLGEAASEPTAIVRVPRDGPLPQSFAQQRLWFLEQFEPNSAFYNVPAPLRLPGPLDAGALQRALTDLVARHEALRTTFDEVDGQPVQVIGRGYEVDLPVHDLRELPASAREPEAWRLTELDAREPFDLRRGPLLRAQLVRLEARDHVLLLCLHHIVCDGWSMDVLFRELQVLYRAHADGQPAELPDLPIQYADFAVWQHRRLARGVLAEQLPYWRRALAGAPALLELPTDRPRPSVQAFRGGVHAFDLPRSVADGLNRLCREQQVTLFMAALAAFAVLLQRYSGRDDIVVGTPIANRSRSELEGLIGFFANTLVLRLDLSGDPTFHELMQRARHVTLGAYEHQDTPFERLVEELEPERNLAYNPLFQVMLVLQNTPGASAAASEASAAGSSTLGTGLSKFDLTAFLTETTGGLSVGLEYNSALFDLETIERMARHLTVLLRAVLAEPGRPISTISLVGDAERRALARWNDTAAPFPAQCVHERFEERAQRAPRAPAVVLGDRTVGYRELDERANGWAHRLVDQGVGPGVCVGIAVERSIELVVAVLAVLKAGGAYVPLDPHYPAERLTLMIADAGIGMLLAHGQAAARMPKTEARILRLDDEPSPPRRSDAPPRRARLDDLAYVIFTSGSTGRPKGVAMPHGPLANLVHWQLKRSSLPAGARTLQFASPSFDVSFQEMLSTLAGGGTLQLVSEEQRRDPSALWTVIREQGVARLFLPYVALQQLAEHAPEGLGSSLREVITAGEQLHVTPAIARLFERLGCPLYNQYGPSETHVVTEHALVGTPERWPARPPIGRPIPNATVHLLDSSGRPVPVGLPGELFLGGDVLARGYIGRPGLTAERFVPDPFAGAPGRRLYRTGDRGRRLPDGTIEFLGRVDDQLKIRGYRVEPGEVESALRRCPGVVEAVVVARRGPADERYLAAYLQLAEGASITAIGLRARLGELLPEPMIPSTFTVLDALPLTPSGKLDRRGLPEPDDVVLSGAACRVLARTPFERRMAELWSGLLRVEAVGIHDGFFELGGHSLLATRLVSHVREEWGVELPLRRVFEAPTIEALSLSVVQKLAEREDHGLITAVLDELEGSPLEAAYPG